MKPLFIDTEGTRNEQTGMEYAGATEITAALSAVNGKAEEHAYTSSHAMRTLANEAEAAVLALVGSKKAAIGAKYFARSGGKLPNAYKYPRKTTLVTLERKSKGWYLADAKAVEAYTEAGKHTVLLTAEQDAIAVARFRKGYSVEAPAPKAEPAIVQFDTIGVPDDKQRAIQRAMEKAVFPNRFSDLY